MSFDHRYIYVAGENPARTPVRPHNWAERFAGNLASYGPDLRLRYSPVLEPMVIDGIKHLRLCRSLETSNPTLLQDVLDFAAHYDLPVHGLIEAAPLAKAS
ncbi:MAG: DUF3579 domain-containing protein [Gammaproteobacteria bacterium]|jgi:hypothetical protein|nr:DUF3579 domain-containing protein [Gammaproteobacteria bacterium]